ncbi:MAG: hypothetical protein GY714_30725 [Desulfobacterales bacterium]|nr:hypothetical protein [Desulfobacterales bacterium]
MNLYWVTTEDNHENWFIVASSGKEAAKCHEDYEGYNTGDAKAEKVLKIPNSIVAETGWPSKELLISLGAKYSLVDNIRIVEISGRKFFEGMLESEIIKKYDDIFEERGDKRLNKTKSSSTH